MTPRQRAEFEQQKREWIAAAMAVAPPLTERQKHLIRAAFAALPPRRQEAAA